MNGKFEIEFLEGAREFLQSIEDKARHKVLYNVEKAKLVNDPKLFKKLSGGIWEFRAESNKLQHRLFAFWDKRDNKNTLVVATHGIIKKTDKVPQSEIDKAIKIMNLYFKQY